jgi:hypothetical protein
LILGAKLTRTVYAGLPQVDRPQAIDPGIVADVLIGAALRTPIGRMEVERMRLGYTMGEIAVLIAPVSLDDTYCRHGSVNLVRRVVQQDSRRQELANGLADIEGAQRVQLEVRPRLGHGLGDRDLTCEMENDVGVTMSLEGRHDLAEISDVSPDERERTMRVEPLEVGIGTGPRQVIKMTRSCPSASRRRSGIGADRTCAPRDDPLHVVLLE